MELDTLPLAIAIVCGLAFSLLFMALAAFLGPRRAGKNKLEPFECGSEPIGSPRVPFSVKFYQVAILFLVFDVEAAFLYPWAVVYRPMLGLGAVILVEMLVFMATLVVGLAYVWRKRAIGWG